MIKMACYFLIYENDDQQYPTYVCDSTNDLYNYVWENQDKESFIIYFIDNINTREGIMEIKIQNFNC